MEKKIKKKVIILGGGISGLSAAWKLAENGYKVEVYEKESYVGGLAATIKKDNKYFLDFGPHPFYTQDIEILDTFKELIGENLLTFNRNCLLFFQNTYINYPPRPTDVLFNMGPKIALYSSLSYVKTKITSIFKSDNNKSFEDWAIDSFGMYLYKIFFKPYTEHFWKLPPDKLADDWADARVAKLNLLKTIKLLFLRGNVGDELNQLERDTLPLLYPEYGCGMLPERIAERVIECGGKYFLNSLVKKVNLNNPSQYHIEINSEQIDKTVKADIIISTIPLKYLVTSILPFPDKKIINNVNTLKSMGLIVVCLVIDKTDILPTSYLYCFDRIYHRITEYNKFSEKLSPENENILSVEISCYEGDKNWIKSNNELSEICANQLIKDGYIEKKQIIRTYILKSKNVYPVYLQGYREPLKEINKFLRQFNNFYCVGRNGSFTYIDQDQAMRIGFNIADRIIKNRSKT